MTSEAKVPPIIMPDAEIEAAEEQSLQVEQEFLDGQQKPKQERTRMVEPRMLRTREAAQYIGVSEVAIATDGLCR